MLSVLLLAAMTAQEPEAPKEAPKEPPKVTIEEKGRFRNLVKTLESKFGCTIKLGESIADKELSINVKDAGFFEALDALCRSHQEVTYLSVGDEARPGSPILVAEPWLEYPASYCGHFKTVLLSMMRTARSTSGVVERKVDVALAVIAPPWIQGGGVGTSTIFRLQGATDADGKNLLAPAFRGEERIRVQPRQADSNLFTVDYSTSLRDFDSSKGLKSFAGRVRFEAHEMGVVRMGAEAGSQAEVPQGKLRIEAVEKDADYGWRIVVAFTPKEGGSRVPLDRILAREARHDGDPDEWGHVRMMRNSLEVATGQDRAPMWVEFRTFQSKRPIDVPFRFSDAVFRGK